MMYNEDIENDLDMILNEAAKLTPAKRKKIQDLIFSTMDALDKTKINGDLYREKFKKMTNEQFDSYMKQFLKDPDANFYYQVLYFENEPSLKTIKKTMDTLNVPTEEYVYFRHDGNKDNPIRTKYKVPTGLMVGSV